MHVSQSPKKISMMVVRSPCKSNQMLLLSMPMLIVSLAHSPSLDVGMGERRLSWMALNDNDEMEVNLESQMIKCMYLLV